MPPPTAPRPISWADVAPLVRERGLSDELVGLMTARPEHATSRWACRLRTQRWKREGLTVWEADRLLTRLGVHPMAVFGQDFYRLPVVDELEHLEVPA